MEILFLLGAVALIAAVSGEASEDSEDSETSAEPERKPSPQSRPEPRPQQVEEYFHYTLASLVLNRRPDTYNPADITERVRKARQRVAATDDAKLVADIQALELKVMDGATAGYASKIWSLLQSIGKLLVGESSGGFESLRTLSRKMILFCLPGSLAELSLQAIPKPPQSADRALWADYYRAVLLTYRKAVEFSRMVEVDDQIMPPLPVLAYLVEKELWPPPVEPAPPVSGEVTAQYAGLGAWASNWVGLHPIESFLFPPGAALPEQAVQLAADVFEQLQAEYYAQTAGIRAALDLCVVPPALAGLASSQGTYPRIGSWAAPITTRPGDLLV